MTSYAVLPLRQLHGGAGTEGGVARHPYCWTEAITASRFKGGGERPWRSSVAQTSRKWDAGYR